MLRTTRRRLAAAAVTAILLIAAPGAVAAAQTRIGLNGGRPSEWPVVDRILANMGFTQAGWLPFASRVGENWLPGTTPVGVDYPAQLGLLSGPFALTVDQSTDVGQRNLHATLLEELKKGQPVVVTGLSEGTLVIDRELAYLQTAADAPKPRDVTFYVFGDMQRGLGDMYLRGVTIPFVGQTFAPVPESRYDVVVVNEQWDGWALPPDRPWHPLAVVNAVIGAFITIGGFNDHTQSALDSMADAVLVSRKVNSQGGTTTTYTIPRRELPITRTLRQIGIPASFVDDIDAMLMPFIAAGYSSMTPNHGPRIEQGGLVFTPPQPPPAPVQPVPQQSAADPPSVTAPNEPAEPVVTRDVPNVVSPNPTKPRARVVHDRPDVADSAEKLRQYRDNPAAKPPTRTKPADSDSDSESSNETSGSAAA